MESCFSGILSELRKKQGISQRKAASDLNISQALLSHYENGVREPGLPFVCRACDYYNVSADYILGRFGAGQNSSFKNASKALSMLSSKLKFINDDELFTSVGLYISAAAQRMLNRLCCEDNAENSLALSMDMARAELKVAQVLHSKTENKYNDLTGT